MSSDNYINLDNRVSILEDKVGEISFTLSKTNDLLNTISVQQGEILRYCKRKNTLFGRLWK